MAPVIALGRLQQHNFSDSFGCIIGCGHLSTAPAEGSSVLLGLVRSVGSGVFSKRDWGPLAKVLLRVPQRSGAGAGGGGSRSRPAKAATATLLNDSPWLAGVSGSSGSRAA